MQEFRNKLIEHQKNVVKDFENLLKEAPANLKPLLAQIVTVQKNVLRKTGYQPPRKEAAKRPPNSSIFEKKKSTVQNIQDIKPIENKDVNESIFEQSDTEAPQATVIENENVNTEVFEQKELPEINTPKANPQRLNPTQIKAIKELAAKGLNPKQISDELHLNQEKIQSFLNRQNKGKGSIIHTSGENDGTIEGDKYGK
jgi:DNA-binding NarL/FixJ family response regulator